MNEKPTVATTRLPLHVLLRRRRKELRLVQSEIAEALNVTAEAVTQWESGRRRMELAKVPRLAVVLHLNGKELCAKALSEFHPIFYATLFGDSALVPTTFKQAPA
jgi:transcriptional regulator with XRE-family HTH domain